MEEQVFLWSINAPPLRNFLISSWILIFITSFRELSTAIFDYSASGPYQPLFVLGILMMLVVFMASILVYRVFGVRQRLSQY